MKTVFRVIFDLLFIHQELFSLILNLATMSDNFSFMFKKQKTISSSLRSLA